jgi:aspartyl-tRNA(Asn)/glutamyl-tRNA(Gln) amidotransferase subunit A
MSNTKYSVPAYFVITRIEAYSNLQRFDGLKYGHTTKRPVEDMYDLYYKSRGEASGINGTPSLTGFCQQEKFYKSTICERAASTSHVTQRFRRSLDPIGKYRLDVL